MNPVCPVCLRESRTAAIAGRFPRHGKVGKGPCTGSLRKVRAGSLREVTR